MIKKSWLSFFLVFCAMAYGFECRGPGGDIGPNPLLDISDSFAPSAHTIRTAGQLQEFFLWENRKLLVYRTEADGVFDTHLGCGLPRPYFTSTIPLSRVVEPEERFMVFEGTGLIYDVKTGMTWKYGFPIPSGSHDTEFHHLFWQNRTLYSVAVGKSAAGNQIISLYRYPLGKAPRQAIQICRSREIPAGQEYQLATGHVFPYASFYRIEAASGGRNLIRLYELNANAGAIACALDNVSTQNWYVAGPVESVHRFPQIDGLAVKMTHPTKNLLWADNTGCRHFHLGDVKTMVPNYELPILFTLASNGDVGLKFLSTHSEAAIGAGHIVIPDVDESNLWLTSDAKKLYIAPTQVRETSLLQIELNTASPLFRNLQ